MKFSLHMPLGDVFPTGEFQTAQAAREIAAALERSRASAGHVTDHPAPSSHWLHTDPTGHDTIDPIAGLAFVAAVTTRLKLMTAVIVLPYRNPFLTAKAAATVQALSDGRLILGVGLGYQEVEFAALGVPFKSRGAIMDEALETIRLAWAGGPVLKRGRSFNAAENEPRPVPSPPPPIWVGGGSEKAVERAARWGDGWTPFFSVPTLNQNVRASEVTSVGQLGEKIALLRERREELGKTGLFDVSINVVVGKGSLSAALAHKCREEVEELASVGVTWVRIKPAAPNRLAYLDNVAWLDQEVMSAFAGASDQTPAARQRAD